MQNFFNEIKIIKVLKISIRYLIVQIIDTTQILNYIIISTHKQIVGLYIL